MLAIRWFFHFAAVNKCFVYCIWEINHPVNQTPYQTINFYDLLQVDGNSEIYSGQIRTTARPSGFTPWEIDTTLMTDGGGDFSGGIGDGAWDYTGTYWVVIWDAAGTSNTAFSHFVVQ